MQPKKIVFLASNCQSSSWVYNALKTGFSFEAAIIENPISKKTLIRARIKRIGFLQVLGQILFSAIIVPLLKIKAKNRREELVKIYGLDDSPVSNSNIVYVDSVNDDACKLKLEQLQPDIIVVNGTRIISKKILQCTHAIFINMHVGITPLYRGSHGGYWALHNKDTANFGTTIHLVDAGVDTGAIIKQVYTEPTMADNFTTYPTLQTAIGINALREALSAIFENNLLSFHKEGKGKLYYQPTIWQYFFGR